MKAIHQCRVCGNHELVPILDLGSISFTGVFPFPDDFSSPEGPLELVKCHGDSAQVCGLVQLRHSFDPHILFGESYGYRSSLNRSMSDHLRNLAEKIRCFVSLQKDDAVVDIGSNDGTLLNCFTGEKLALFGIDPTAAQFGRYYASEISIIADFFSGTVLKQSLNGRKAKVISAIAVFYDFSHPQQFLEEIEMHLADEGVFIIEQCYLPSVITNIAYDTVCHEHAAYYRLKQIKWLADRAGLKIIDCEENSINGGSFCVVLAKKGASFPERDAVIKQFMEKEDAAGLDSLDPYSQFREKVFSHRVELIKTLAELTAAGQKIIGCGASTKGNVLLQFCGFTRNDISFVAEVNEDKFGRVCPGSRIPIISERDAFEMNPDILLVLPWHFKEFFWKRKDHYLRNEARFLFPLPSIEIFGG